MDASSRLIVAADFDPRREGGAREVHDRVLVLAKSLEGTGVIIKVNSVLRAYGYTLISELHDLGLQVFADLKLTDIPNTVETDGAMLKEYKPEFITVMCSTGIDGMRAVRETVGQYTQVLGVTVLTSFNEEECQEIFGCSTKAGVLRFARMAQLAGLSGLILSPQEAEIIKARPELTLSLNTPGIRPLWSLVAGDDQERVMTPAKAIKAGAMRVVIGRPIIQAEDPRHAVELALQEITEGLPSE
ncbi:MAG: orotidine-5'-phosphate decarboxylase [bacterium]|nr:orotidine-5'-phosphate decarboxylase [bacterium]